MAGTANGHMPALYIGAHGCAVYGGHVIGTNYGNPVAIIVYGGMMLLLWYVVSVTSVVPYSTLAMSPKATKKKNTQNMSLKR